MYKDYSKVNEEKTDISAINHSIKNILNTRRGSVPGIPRFGSDLYKLVFSQLDSLTESVAISMVKSALQEFEDRIVVQNVNLKSIAEYNRLVIEITYTYRDKFNSTSEASTVISISQ